MFLRIVSFIFIWVAVSCNCTAQYNVDRLMTNGRVALHYEDYVLSIQYFNHAINQKPYLWEPWQLRAISKFYLEDWQGAEEDASKALELNPYVVSLYDLRGLSRIRLNKYADAINDYTKAISIESNNQNYWYNRALCSLEMKDYDCALAQLDTIISKWSNYVTAYIVRGEVYLQKKDTINALQSIEQALMNDRHCADAWRMKAYILFSKSQWREAEESFDNALKYKPKDVGCYINRGLSRFHQNNLRGAMSDYDIAIDLSPDNFLAHYNRGLLRSQVGDDNRAIEDFNHVLTYEPYNIMALFNRATLLDKTGNLRAAIRDYSLVIEKFPNFWTGLQYRAACYRKLGMIAMAEKDEFRILSAQMNKHLGVQQRWSKGQLSAMRKLNEIDLDKYHEPIIDDTHIEEHEYMSEYRGKIQNRQTTITFQPYIALTIDNKNMPEGTRMLFDTNMDNYIESVKRILLNCNFVPILGRIGEGTGTATFAAIDSINQYIPDCKNYKEANIMTKLRSVAYSSAQNYQDAIKDLNNVLESEPDNAIALWQKIVCMSMLAEYEHDTSNATSSSIMHKGIVLEYDRLNEKIRNNALILYNEATFYARCGEYQKALELFSTSIKNDERLACAYFNRGIIFLKTNNIEDATKDLSKAGELGLYSAYSLIKNNRIKK